MTAPFRVTQVLLEEPQRLGWPSHQLSSPAWGQWPWHELVTPGRPCEGGSVKSSAIWLKPRRDTSRLCSVTACKECYLLLAVYCLVLRRVGSATAKRAKRTRGGRWLNKFMVAGGRGIQVMELLVNETWWESKDCLKDGNKNLLSFTSGLVFYI